MLKKSFKRSIFTLILVLGTFFILSTKVEAKKIPTAIEKANLYGKYNFNSNDLKTVIIELEEDSLVQAKHTGKYQTEQKLKAAREAVVKNIYKHTTEVNVIREYDYLFSGFAVEIPEDKIFSLVFVPGIKAIYPNIHYETTEIGTQVLETFEPQMQDSMPYVGAPEVWSMGYTGEGMTVAVIDSGVDYTHPELAHAFGEYKGYDFYDNDYDPMDGGYHGTHVTGTIVAQSFGIAPEARILAYRVLGPNGGTSAQVIAGIEQAVKDGADVMNLSLGNDLNNPDYATSIALDWAMAEGVVAVTSSGNNGPDDWTVGAPGASREAISVGSTKLPYIDVDFFTSLYVPDYPTAKVMGYNDYESLFALSGNTYEFEFVGLGSVDEYVDVDMEGKVALIIRGELAFVEKAQIAKDHGAVAAIIFNNATGEINTSGEFPLPTFQLDYNDGFNMLTDWYFGDNNVTINLADYGETISDFSSRGPAYSTWMIKPDVSAPGNWILSTYPGGYYAYAGGTSMASPHVAAAAALILQAHPEYTPQEVKAALMNTADKMIDPLTGDYYPHNVQGAGSMRIVDAIKAETLVTPGSYSFGKFIKTNGKQVEKQFFEIKNLSNERKTYTFNVEFAGNPQGIKVSTANNLKVNANSTQKVNMNVQVDTSKLAPGRYEGTITICDGIETIIVPTILFIQEPDYPRVSFAGIQDNGDGTYLAYGYLPAGAEYAEIGFFTFNEANGTIGEFLDAPFYAYNLEPGYYIELWDGTVQGFKLPPGQYVIACYAEYLGVNSITATLFEIK